MAFVRREETRKGGSRYTLLATKKNRKALKGRLGALRKNKLQVMEYAQHQPRPEPNNSFEWLSNGN